MQRPTYRYEWNPNSIISILGFLLTLGSLAFAYGRFTGQVDNLKTSAATAIGTIERRLDRLEAESKAIDNLSYRMTVQEQGATSLTRTVDELRQAISQQNSDIRLIREIVTRLDPGPARKP